MSITRTIVIDDLTPEELAHIFAEMDGDQQARFFSNVGQIAATWPGAGWCQQSCEISRHLDQIGTETILKLGEWAAEPYQAEPGNELPDWRFNQIVARLIRRLGRSVDVSVQPSSVSPGDLWTVSYNDSGRFYIGQGESLMAAMDAVSRDLGHVSEAAA